MLAKKAHPKRRDILTLSKYNPTYIGYNNALDEYDKFACNILKLHWPEDTDAKLWRIEGEAEMIKHGKDKRLIGPMAISHFSSTVTKNPYYKKKLIPSFSFPKALSDDTVQKLIQAKELTQKVETGMTIHLKLENTTESLKKLGLISDAQKTPQDPILNTQQVVNTKQDQTGSARKEQQTTTAPTTHISGSDTSHPKSNTPFIAYVFFGSIAGLSLMACLLKILSQLQH